jgi:hypothetical protein
MHIQQAPSSKGATFWLMLCRTCAYSATRTSTKISDVHEQLYKHRLKLNIPSSACHKHLRPAVCLQYRCDQDDKWKCAVQVRALRPPAGCAVRTAALCWLSRVVTARAQYPDARWQFMADIQVRKTPCWPRSWANFSLLCLYSHRKTTSKFSALDPPPPLPLLI